MMVGGPAMAQSRYTCRSDSGGYYQSGQPCSGTSRGIGYSGPTVQAAQSTYMPRMAEAPDHLKYLGPQCSAMNDAIRTGPARGVRSETTAELQRNYYRQCAEDESEARRKMDEDRRFTNNQRKDAQQAVQANQQRSQLLQQQCEESKRILYMKKRRTDLNAGEQADLQRFEENYKSRCS